MALDRLCRRKALSAFSPMAGAPQSPLLFLNFESSVLDQGVLRSGVLTRAVSEAGLDPGQIVIEINESKVADVEALERFVEIHRKQGFLFALDDLGAGFSNLDRIGLLKPEILKLARSLIVGIERDFHKQELFKSLVGLGRRVGSLVLAEGVETDEEVSICVDLGADMVQGFFFGRPAAVDRLSLELVDSHLSAVAEKQRIRAAERLGRHRAEKAARSELMAVMLSETASSRYAGFADTLAGFALRSSHIECLYVLGSEGLQVTPTVFASTMADKPRTRLFQPATQGAIIPPRSISTACPKAAISPMPRSPTFPWPREGFAEPYPADSGTPTGIPSSYAWISAWGEPKAWRRRPEAGAINVHRPCGPRPTPS